MVKQATRDGLRAARVGIRGQLLLGALFLCAGPLAAQAAPAVGDAAPTVTVPDLDGNPLHIGPAASGHPVVVEFWATWCPICKALLPEMRAAQKRFGDRVDFFGVNVTVNDAKDHVRRYLSENRPPWITAYDDRGVAVRAFGAAATSYVVIIDAKGRIAYTGDGSDQKITAELARILGR